MTKSYSVGFENVELVDGLGEDKPVWLYMRATLFNDGDFDHPIWLGEVGSLPPDANRPQSSFTGFPIGNAGRYADHLIVGTPVGSHSDTGIPKFSVGPVEVAPGQVLEVMVFMLPLVWFETVRVPASDLDRLAYGAFGFLLASSGVGIAGGIVGGLFGSIFGPKDQYVEVPCFNTVISARHVFTPADLDRIESAGSERFGPQDNEAYAVCRQPIDSYYSLSVNNRGMHFGETPEPKKEICLLEPRAYLPMQKQFTGYGWGDVGDRFTDCLQVYVSFPVPKLADVQIFRGSGNNSQLIAEFHQVHVTREKPLPDFQRNIFDEPGCPARSVKPDCPWCLRFANLPLEMHFHPALLFLGMLPGSHIGTRPPFPIAINNDRITRVRTGPKCAFTKGRKSKHASKHQDLHEPIQFSSRFNLQLKELNTIRLWPTGTLPTRNLVVASHLINDEVILAPELPISWVLHCSPEFTLATYQEIRGDSGCVGRLRYTRRNSQGEIIADVMLTRLPEILH